MDVVLSKGFEWQVTIWLGIRIVVLKFEFWLIEVIWMFSVICTSWYLTLLLASSWTIQYFHVFNLKYDHQTKWKNIGTYHDFGSICLSLYHRLLVQQRVISMYLFEIDSCMNNWHKCIVYHTNWHST